ncbi:hypothetical protein HDU98_001881, partial [Podochytrium sp. JEL0797]
MIGVYPNLAICSNLKCPYRLKQKKSFSCDPTKLYAFESPVWALCNFEFVELTK